MLTDNAQPTFEKVDGYRYFNFAILHSRGFDHVFDVMRYDRSFLCRRPDLEKMIEAAANYAGKGALAPTAILLCRYDWKGKTKPSWTHNRLLSNQEFELIDGVERLYELNSDVLTLRPGKPLKVRANLEVTGELPWVLEVMYDNQAMPATEGDAHKIERAFYAAPGEQEITVTLTNFRQVEAPWTLPPKP